MFYLTKVEVVKRTFGARAKGAPLIKNRFKKVFIVYKFLKLLVFQTVCEDSYLTSKDYTKDFTDTHFRFRN